MPTPQAAQQSYIDAILTPELLNRIRSRAAGYDERNEFPTQDVAELAEAGYLKALAPREMGGLGWDFSTLVDAQRILAMYSPATALSVNMHQIWTGVASIFADRGDDSLRFILQDAVDGEFYAFGISEAGNDAVLFDSNTLAEEQPDGSVKFTGTKIFTTGSPAWTKLGTFGKTPDGNSLIFGILDRSAGGITTDGSTWDMLGMRPTHSFVTTLDAALIPEDRIIRRISPVGPNQDLLTFGIFASFLTLIAAVYTGIGDRAVELAVEALNSRKSKVHGTALSQDPILRYKTGEAVLRQYSMNAQLNFTAEAIQTNHDFGAEWFTRLVANKTQAIRVAKQQVDFAFEGSGGASFSRHSEISRLYRDVIAGVFHPSDDESAHNTFANFTLGMPES